jgi:glycosyltransferase involved in cell wall biosynthesis
MYKNKKISVIMPCYNEADNIKKAIESFLNIKEVDEVLVVDNNSTDNSVNEVKKTKAMLINEKKQGYGHAIQKGYHEAKGEILITCEPDGTFLAEDIYKLLLYSDEFDVVFGTRTSKECIWKGANMFWFLRLGNVFVAKLLEYLHNGPCLTDVGCTFKLIKMPVYSKIKTKLKVGGSHFSPELMIECIRHTKCIEIPVNYMQRIGTSKITGDFWKAFKLGINMIALIIYKKLRK